MKPIIVWLKETNHQVRVQTLQRLYFSSPKEVFNILTVKCTNKYDIDYICNCPYLLVIPMEFQINVIGMVAYREIIVAVVTWLLPGQPSSLRFDYGQGYLNWLGFAAYISSCSVGDGALFLEAQWAMPEIDHIIQQMRRLRKRESLIPLPFLFCTRPLEQVYR